MNLNPKAVIALVPLLRIDVEKPFGRGVILRWKGEKIPLVQRIRFEAVAEGGISVILNWPAKEELDRLRLSRDPAITQAVDAVERIQKEIAEFLNTTPSEEEFPLPTIWDRLRDEPE